MPSVAPVGGAEEAKRKSAADSTHAGECSVSGIAYDILWSLEFPKNAATIPEDQLETLEKVARFISKKWMRVTVEGHADPSESDPGLSLARAKNVVEQMIRFGTDPGRLIVVDKGTSPAPQGIERNSRVSFKDAGYFRPCE